MFGVLVLGEEVFEGRLGLIKRWHRVGGRGWRIAGVTCAHMAPLGPLPAILEPMVTVELERIEALELLGMVISHLNEPRIDPLTPRLALLMSIQGKLNQALWEEP